MEKSPVYSSAPKPPKQIRVQENATETVTDAQILQENKSEQASTITVMQPAILKNTIVKLKAENPQGTGSTNEENGASDRDLKVTDVTFSEQNHVSEKNLTEKQLLSANKEITADNQTEIPVDFFAKEAVTLMPEPEKDLAAELQPELTGQDAIKELAEMPYQPKPENEMGKADNDPATEQPVAEEISTNQTTRTISEKTSKNFGSAKQKTEPEHDFENLKIPADDELFQRQYYTMGEVATMFHANQSQIRFWENEFDILQPKKNKKGDRYFRPEDVKNLQVIHHLLRNRRFTIEGAREYLKSNKQRTQDTIAAITSLNQIKSFLTELKANL